jgi:hypothetical protein
MRLLKPIVSMVMALLIGITSVGFAVSAHTCSESGFTETSLTPLKACCKQSEGKGFQAVPCCSLSVKHIKLPTVRTAVQAIELPQNFLLPLQAIVPSFSLVLEPVLTFTSTPDPPQLPPLATGRAIQTQFCRFLI